MQPLNKSSYSAPRLWETSRKGSLWNKWTFSTLNVTMYRMPKPLTHEAAAVRRARILTAARWCFLNFGFAKTAFEDIAKRANLSRTLLYRMFKDKEDDLPGRLRRLAGLPAACREARRRRAWRPLRALAQRVPVDGA